MKNLQPAESDASAARNCVTAGADDAPGDDGDPRRKQTSSDGLTRVRFRVKCAVIGLHRNVVYMQLHSIVGVKCIGMCWNFAISRLSGSKMGDGPVC